MNLCKRLFGFSLLLSEQAFAEAEQQATDLIGSGATAQILLVAAAFVFIYFVVIRPQNKRAKDHQQLVTSLQKGDEVITSGGILGKISRVTDNFLIVSIAEGVEVPIQKQAIATAVPKGTLKTV